MLFSLVVLVHGHQFYQSTICIIKILCFVAGTGVGDINDALSGSLTYQPAVSSDLLDILVSILCCYH